MNDDKLRRIVMDAVPPLAAPADRMQAVARRLRRGRLRSAATSGAAGITVVAVAVAVAGMLGNGSATTAGSQPGAATPVTPRPTLTPKSVSSTSPRSTKDGRPTEDPQVAKVRIDRAAKGALGAVVPGSTITKSTPVGHQDDPDRFAYSVAYTVKAHGLTGWVEITISMPMEGQALTCAAAKAANASSEAPRVTCHDGTGPHGEHIMSFPKLGDGPINGQNGTVWGTSATVTRADGSIVEVLCLNEAAAGPGDRSSIGNARTGSFTGKRQPLTAEEVIAIALEPGLTLYP